jgi:hypothetical protein
MNEDKNNSPSANEEFEKAVLKAIRRSPWMIPQTVNDVRLAEEEIASSSVNLPAEIADPYSVMDRERQGIRITDPLQADRDLGLEQNLAQAARDGGEIPPEVREQMQKDRKAAEKENDG